MREQSELNRLRNLHASVYSALILDSICDNVWKIHKHVQITAHVRLRHGRGVFPRILTLRVVTENFFRVKNCDEYFRDEKGWSKKYSAQTVWTLSYVNVHNRISLYTFTNSKYLLSCQSNCENKSRHIFICTFSPLKCMRIWLEAI